MIILNLNTSLPRNFPIWRSEPGISSREIKQKGETGMPTQITVISIRIPWMPALFR